VFFNHGVAGPAGSQLQPKPGSVSVRAGQAMVDMNPIITNAERVQTVEVGVRSCCSLDTPGYPTKSSFITSPDDADQRARQVPGNGPEEVGAVT
jgi:hypothetical protein